MKDFRKLDVWAKAHAFALAIYRGTTSFPTEERYGLTSQLRRAASSIYSVSVQPGQIFRKKVLVERTLQCYKNQEEEDA